VYSLKGRCFTAHRNKKEIKEMRVEGEASFPLLTLRDLALESRTLGDEATRRKNKL
jgi:hypothetical protein